MSVPNHNLHHKGRLHSADGSFYEVRLHVHIDASSGPAVSTWPLRNLRIDTGSRGASENKCLYEGQADVEFLCDDAGAFTEASQAAEGQAVMDIVRASSKADFGTTAEEVIWKGYLLSDFYSRSLKGKEQSVKVTGKTGLNRLEGIPFDPVSDVPDLVEQDGRMRYIDAVAYCLGKLREDMDISSASALYATREDGSAMAETAPLSQIKIDAARLYPSEKRIFNFDAGVSGVEHVNLGAGALSSGSATDCKTALQLLLGDEGGEAGLRKLFPSRLNGRAAWLIVGRPLEELSAGYQRYRYALASTGGAVYQDQELFDPAVVEGEDVTFFRSDSNPAKQYRNSLRQATVEYAHLAVPNLLRYGPLEIWNSADNSPYGWTPENAAADFSAKVIYHQDAPYDQNTPEEVGQTGLAMQAYARSGRTDPEPYSRALNEAHWHHDSAEYKTGDLVKISARLYARILPEFEDRTGSTPFSVPFGVELHADDGTTYYLSRRRYPNGTYKIASWETDPQLAGTPVFAVEGNEHDEDSITAPALPADGSLRFRLLRTFTTSVLEEVAWGGVDLSLVDGQGEVLEGVMRTAAVPDVEGELREVAVTGFGDGPAQSQGALLVQNAAGTWGPSEFWRFGFSSSPPENGGAGIPLAQYHARVLAMQRARPRHERTGTMTWGMKPHVVPAFESVFVTDEGRLAPVSTRWHVASGELDGRWVEVSTLTEDGTAPSVTEGSRVQASASSLPSANVVTRLGERVSRVQEEERDRQRLTRLSADVPAGSVTSLPVEPPPEASEMLRAGRKVLVIGSYGETWTFEIATTYQVGQTSLDVIDKTIEGRILAGAYVLPGKGEALSVISQHADAIRNTLISEGQVVTELTLDLQGMLFQGDRFATTTFDGTYGTDAQGHTTITDPGTTGAAITENGDAAFEGVFAREFVTEGTADDKYLLVSGDTMEGDLTFSDGTTNHALLRGESGALGLYAADGSYGKLRASEVELVDGAKASHITSQVVEFSDSLLEVNTDATSDGWGGLYVNRGPDLTDEGVVRSPAADRWGTADVTNDTVATGTFQRFLQDGDDATLRTLLMEGGGDLPVAASTQGGALNFVRNNNSMEVGLSSANNDRRGSIQVRHRDDAFSESYGELLLQPLGGQVAIGRTDASDMLHVGGAVRMDAQASNTLHAVRADRKLSGGLNIKEVGDFTDDRTIATVTNPTFEDGVFSETYNTGVFGGSGYALDPIDGLPNQYRLSIHEIAARRLRVYELLAQQIRATGGSNLVSDWGKAESVEDLGDGSYRITTDEEHTLMAGDVVRAQRYTNGTYSSDAVVTAVPDANTFDLALGSVDDAGNVVATTDPPGEGYVYVRLGNRTDTNRQSVIYDTSADVGAPFRAYMDGITSHVAFDGESTTVQRSGNLSGFSPANANGFGTYTEMFRGTKDVLVGSLDKSGPYMEADGTTLAQVAGDGTRTEYGADGYETTAPDGTVLQRFSGGGGYLSKQLAVGGRSLSVYSFSERPTELWHFDTHLAGSLSGREPSTTPVVTMRADGKYGGCVAVERGTTNLLSSPPTDYIQKSVDAARDYDVYSVPVSGGTTYTVSVEVGQWARQGGDVYALWAFDNGTDRASVRAEGQTGRLTVTITTASDATELSVRVGAGVTTDATVDMTYRRPQVEQQPHATSFVDGTRSTGQLTYDLTVSSTYTVTWEMALDGDTYNSGAPPIRISQGGSQVEVAPTGTTGQLKLQAGIGGIDFQDTFSRPSDGFHRYSLVVQGADVTLYIGDQVVASGTMTGGFNPTALAFGGDKSQRIDELLILPYALDGSEIERLALSDSPVTESPQQILLGEGNVLADSIRARHIQVDDLSALEATIAGWKMSPGHLYSSFSNRGELAFGDSSQIHSGFHSGTPSGLPTLAMRLGSDSAERNFLHVGETYDSDGWSGRYGISLTAGKAFNEPFLVMDVDPDDETDRRLKIAGVDFDRGKLYTNQWAIRASGSGYFGDGFEWDDDGSARLVDLDITGTLTMGTSGQIASSGGGYDIQDDLLWAQNGGFGGTAGSPAVSLDGKGLTGGNTSLVDKGVIFDSTAGAQDLVAIEGAGLRGYGAGDATNALDMAVTAYKKGGSFEGAAFYSRKKMQLAAQEGIDVMNPMRLNSSPLVLQDSNSGGSGTQMGVEFYTEIRYNGTDGLGNDIYEIEAFIDISRANGGSPQSLGVWTFGEDNNNLYEGGDDVTYN